MVETAIAIKPNRRKKIEELRTLWKTNMLRLMGARRLDIEDPENIRLGSFARKSTEVLKLYSEEAGDVHVIE